ncbi:MAG: GNAT family N-acetyltransferase [Candidatus Heimdallarchaeota archaeon]|nr:GNAT family N-acetyltransferase [Candidatus Heimdallarchaeota archaeon]
MALTSRIEYRFATKEDQESIYDFAMRAIAESILPRFAEDAGEDLSERITNGDPHNVAIATDLDLDSGIVGFIEIDPSRSNKKSEVYIRGIFVLESHRRMGIGNKLIKMMLEEHSRRGDQLFVEAFTEDGLRFWQSFGFKIDHFALSYQPNDN